MAVGISTSVANGWLDTVAGSTNGVTYTAEPNLYFQLHTGDPGASGTSNVSSTTDRQEAQMATASGGSQSLSNSPQWTNWSGTDGETVSHISSWDASSSGTFLWSAALDDDKVINTGDTFTINSATVSFTPAS